MVSPLERHSRGSYLGGRQGYRLERNVHKYADVTATAIRTHHVETRVDDDDFTVSSMNPKVMPQSLALRFVSSFRYSAKLMFVKSTVPTW
jgi:hypothetical protein